MVTLQEAENFRQIYIPIIRRSAWMGFFCGAIVGLAAGATLSAILFMH
jgi:hypothetical protein